MIKFDSAQNLKSIIQIHLEQEKQKTEEFIREKEQELHDLLLQRVSILEDISLYNSHVNISNILFFIVNAIVCGLILFSLPVVAKMVGIIVESILIIATGVEINEEFRRRAVSKKHALKERDLNSELYELNQKSQKISCLISEAKNHLQQCNRLLSSANVLKDLQLDSLTLLDENNISHIYEQIDYSNIHFDNSIGNDIQYTENGKKLIKKM